jgi:uncharacterized protein (DUF4415 family)
MPNKQKEFPFHRTRRATAQETAEHRRAIDDQFGIKLRKRGRPVKDKSEKYVQISLRLDPAVMQWAREQAVLKGVGYQTVINDTLKRASQRGANRLKQSSKGAEPK